MEDLPLCPSSLLPLPPFPLCLCSLCSPVPPFPCAPVPCAPALAVPRSCAPDAGIPREQDWGINLKIQPLSPSSPSPLLLGPCFLFPRCLVADTGIASEQDWGINLKIQPLSESGLNGDGSTWYRESGETSGRMGTAAAGTSWGGTPRAPPSGRRRYACVCFALRMLNLHVFLSCYL